MSEDKQHLLKNGVANEQEYDDNDYSGYRFIKWFKRIGKPEIFLINFSIVAILQGATFTYMIGSLSTLEKRYAFESKISGFILIADNVSQIIISPLVGYLGNKYNRPRIMAIGELIAAFSCFVFVAPYFLYGPAINLLHNSHTSYSNSTYELCRPFSKVDEVCNANTLWTAVIILWTGSFLNGIGFTAFYTIGIPYIDDNASKKNSPLYLSASAALRLFGPALGLLLSSYFLNFYENPRIHINIPPTDPRWIGCWWMGFIVIGVFLIIFSIPLAFYPEIKDREKAAKQKNISTIKHQIFDALDATKRLSKNPVFVFHVLGIGFKIIGYLGYYIFKPKYIESQFRKSASDANFWVGFIILPTMAFGIISSGIVLSRYRPKARSVAIYTLIVEIILTITILYPKSLQCPPPIFPQANSISGRLERDASCYGDCHCSTRAFQPVCSSNGVHNYFTPCHAGCTQEEVLDIDSNKRLFSGCKCDHFGGKLTNGYCPSDCNQFTKYIIWFAIVGVITSTSKIGDTLITLRCIDPKDKNFALGITGGFLAIFAFIPYPIIFGAITDSACKVWERSCGGSGNCWLYDIPKLTKYLHNSSFGFLFVGALLHLFVVIYANRIPDMFEEEEEDIDDIDSVAIFEDENKKKLGNSTDISKEN